MTPKAAAAYDLYVSLGPSRSFAKTAETMICRGHVGKCSAIVRQLERWSVAFQWQDRLASSVTALTDARLEMAAELDAASFLKTSELITERLTYTSALDMNTVLAVRQAVRKPAPKSPTVNVNLILADLVERHGLTPDEAAALEADMREHLAATKVGA